MLQSWLAQMGAVAVVGVCLYAVIAGSWRERFGAIIYLSAYFLTIAFGIISTNHLAWYLLVSDVLCLLGFFMLCFKSRHPWPMWAMWAQLACVGVSLVALLNIGLAGWGYLTIETAAGWGVMLALLVGTIAAAEARRNRKRA